MEDLLSAEWEEATKLFPPAPKEAETLLWQAARSWEDTDRAWGHLSLADESYGMHLPVVLACYKFLFYKGRLRQAIPYAQRAARIMGERLGLPPSFWDVSKGDAAFSEFEAGPRFYLFAMKAIGYLKARLGEIEPALLTLQKVLDLDPADHMGVGRLIKVIERGGREEE